MPLAGGAPRLAAGSGAIRDRRRRTQNVCNDRRFCEGREGVLADAGGARTRVCPSTRSGHPEPTEGWRTDESHDRPSDGSVRGAGGRFRGGNDDHRPARTGARRVGERARGRAPRSARQVPAGAASRCAVRDRRSNRRRGDPDHRPRRSAQDPRESTRRAGAPPVARQSPRRVVRRAELPGAGVHRTQRPELSPAVGPQKHRPGRQRIGRCRGRRHWRDAGVGRVVRFDGAGRRDRRHRHRLHASGSRGERLVGAGSLHGDDRRHDHHLSRRVARIQRHHADVQSDGRPQSRHPRLGDDRRDRRQRRRRRRRQLDHAADGHQVPRRERQRLAGRRDQRDRLRHPGQARVCGDRRRERARPVEQLGRRRLLAGDARRNQRRQRRGHAVRRGGRQQRVQQRRAADLSGQLHARRT